MNNHGIRFSDCLNHMKDEHRHCENFLLLLYKSNDDQRTSDYFRNCTAYGLLQQRCVCHWDHIKLCACFVWSCYSVLLHQEVSVFLPCFAFYRKVAIGMILGPYGSRDPIIKTFRKGHLNKIQS